MVNKDQLEQTSEGKQVLALMAEHFTDEQFQPALTLIEQRYTEDLTVWDAELNSDSKLPFSRTTSAQRLLIFFTSPDRLTIIQDELARREAEHARQAAEVPAKRIPAAAKPNTKVKARKKTGGSARKVRGQKVAAKAVKKKPVTRKKVSPPSKRRKQKSVSSKAQKPRAKKKQKASKKKRR